MLSLTLEVVSILVYLSLGLGDWFIDIDLLAWLYRLSILLRPLLLA